MTNIRLTALGRALAVALALAAASAAADPPGARAAEEAARRVFRDWRLACAPEGCRAETEVRGQGGGQVLVMAATGGALVLRTALPLFLPDGAALGVGDEPPRPIPWRTCDTRGCEAEAPLDAALLEGLRRERAAEVTLTLVDGVRVRLLVSLMGFSAASEALGPSAGARAALHQPGGGATSP